MPVWEYRLLCKPCRLTSYLSSRTQFVQCSESTSLVTDVLCRVPQGSVFGLILFLLYTADLLRLFESNRLCLHLYADDMHLSSNRHHTAATGISACIDEVAIWIKFDFSSTQPKPRSSGACWQRLCHASIISETWESTPWAFKNVPLYFGP